MNRLLLRLTLAASLVLTPACANNNYDGAKVTNQLGDPAAIVDLREGISIPEGDAVSANIQLVAVDGDNLSGSLRSLDPTVLLVSESSTSSNVFVFVAEKAGTTTVQILVSGIVVATVPASVVKPGSEDVLDLPPDAGTTVGPDDEDAGADAGDDAFGDDAGDDSSGDDAGSQGGGQGQG